jgi:hypothetical protein
MDSPHDCNSKREKSGKKEKKRKRERRRIKVHQARNILQRTPSAHHSIPGNDVFGSCLIRYRERRNDFLSQFPTLQFQQTIFFTLSKDCSWAYRVEHAPSRRTRVPMPHSVRHLEKPCTVSIPNTTTQQASRDTLVCLAPNTRSLLTTATHAPSPQNLDF